MTLDDIKAAYVEKAAASDQRIEAIIAKARSGTLDEAWKEAEAAMPEDWAHVAVVKADFPTPGRAYEATAGRWRDARELWGHGDTPTAALQALTVARPGGRTPGGDAVTPRNTSRWVDMKPSRPLPFLSVTSPAPDPEIFRVA